MIRRKYTILFLLAALIAAAAFFVSCGSKKTAGPSAPQTNKILQNPETASAVRETAVPPSEPTGTPAKTPVAASHTASPGRTPAKTAPRTPTALVQRTTAAKTAAKTTAPGKTATPAKATPTVTPAPTNPTLNKTYTVDPHTLGLTVDKDGTMLLAGKPYYGFGVNSFTMAIRYIEGAGRQMYRDQFEILKKYDIPFVRINFGGYWPDYYWNFDYNSETILRQLRDVVECAEEYNIGLICSLMWYDGAISYYVGEHRSDMGNPNSATVKYAKNYVATIVKEFKDSPAIWAWEIGNEYNLGADLCDPTFRSKLPNGPCTPYAPSGFDFYTSKELRSFYTEIGNTIRKYDKTRMITTGDGDMRNASLSLRDAAQKMNPATHLWTEQWTQDTPDDFYKMCAYFTPDPLNTISFHLQHAQQDGNGRASFLLTLDRFRTKVSTLKYFQEYVTAARLAKKGLFFGEMGDMMYMEGDKDAINVFRNVTDWIVQAEIQMAATWQFSNNDLKATDSGIDGQKLRILQEKNKNYKKDGKADTEIYWANK